jgi:hypothetical protein
LHRPGKFRGLIFPDLDLAIAKIAIAFVTTVFLSR